ncbi:polysaccharide deacetylase family protein, partial [Georgenia sp. 10Sc9-8]|nr:polysaccharide deacetylase family protein [Georgenia halotolerans]
STLRQTGTPASFFVTGEWTQDNPQTARQLATGYPVGNHSVPHADLTTLSDAAARAEVAGADLTVRQVAWVPPRGSASRTGRGTGGPSRW